jgi:endoglucanase
MRHTAFETRAAVAIIAAASLLASALLAPISYAQSSPPANTGLHVAGNQILNDAGQIVTLHGVNMMDGYAGTCLIGPPGRPSIFVMPTDQAAVDVMKTWHVTSVRIIINQDCWLGINGVNPLSSGAVYQDEIVRFVNLLTQNGMVVILSDLWTTALVGPYKLKPMPDAVNSPVVWKAIASIFKGNTAVAFELFNEPAPDGGNDTTAAWKCVRDGGTCPGVPYKAIGMQGLTNVVRATGATNLILAPGARGAQTLNRYLEFEVKDPLNNVAPVWHAYAPSYCHDVNCWNVEIAPTAAKRPLVASEIGQYDNQASYINALMPWLDAHSSSYLVWAWYAPETTTSLLVDNDGTPSSYGVGLRDHLQMFDAWPTSIPSETPTPSDPSDESTTQTGP